MVVAVSVVVVVVDTEVDVDCCAAVVEVGGSSWATCPVQADEANRKVNKNMEKRHTHFTISKTVAGLPHDQGDVPRCSAGNGSLNQASSHPTRQG